MKILAVAGGEKSANALEALIDEKGEHSVTPSIGASTARRMVLDEEWDTVIINYPLSDEPGIDLAHMIASETNSSVIMILKEDLIPIFGRDLENAGILIVSKPILKPILYQTIMLASTIRARLQAKDREIKKLEAKLDEARVVARAKCLMIENGDMGEKEAHKLIERTAMNRRITLKDAALLLSRKYKEQ